MKIRLFLLVSISTLFAHGEVTTEQLLFLADHSRQPKLLDEGPYNKNEIITYLKAWDGRGVEIIDGRYLTGKTQLLGNLGDRETIEKAYSLYLNGETIHERLRGFRAMRFSHPEILRVLGDDINKPITRLYLYHERGDFLEVPYLNAAFISAIVQRSGFFPDDAVEWINRLEGGTDEKKAYTNLERIREFWKLNRKAIISKEYEKVIVPPYQQGTRKTLKTQPGGRINSVRSAHSVDTP